MDFYKYTVRAMFKDGTDRLMSVETTCDDLLDAIDEITKLYDVDVWSIVRTDYFPEESKKELFL